MELKENSMKLLVIQEQHFTKLPNGEVWADKQSNEKFWQRYLNVFDEVVVCARMKESDTLGTKALKSSRKGVSFIGMPDFRGSLGIIKNYCKIRKALHDALKETDCVIFRAPSPISMVSYSIVKKTKKPFAVELMNNPMTHFSKQSMHHFYQPLIQKFITRQTKRMCRKANGVSYVTDHVLQELYPSTARIKGESEKYFESSYSTINLSEENYVSPIITAKKPVPVVLVHSGEMMDYRKGQDVFIRALAYLKEKGYFVKGILIGDGDLRTEFEMLAKELGLADDVEFVGWKSGFDAVQKELLKGQMFVFPSTGEGLPRSVIEAMASGLLCFGSRIDGIVELLNDALLVDEFNGEAFGKKIEPFLQNWNEANNVRTELFDKSKKYVNTELEKKRTDFYMRLRKCAEE